MIYNLDKSSLYSKPESILDWKNILKGLLDTYGSPSL